jgi:hypothetical protein
MKKLQRQSGNFKVLGAIIAVLAIAFVFQAFFFHGKDEPTGFAVKDTTPVGNAISIISPSKSSLQSPGFTIQIKINDNTGICYYRTDDSGEITWDRRMRPCSLSLAILPEYCHTKGANTCKVTVEAEDLEGNILGSDSAYFSIN